MSRTIGSLIIATFLIAFLPIKSTGQVLFGYVLYKSRDCQSYTYDIDLNFYQSAGSTVLFGGGDLHFGDGSGSEIFDVSNPDSVVMFRNGYALRIFKTTHTYPGPGIYTIKYREYNRVSRIDNIDNSVNTPFYVESQINIDPYNGCNNSPVLTSLFPLNGAMYNLYTFSLLGSDIDADSISYRLTIPKMDIDEPVKGYWIPGSINDKNDILLSQLYLNNFTGEIIWQYPNDPGLFNFALQVHEWRYLASLKEWINMGFVTYDFNTNILEGDNPGSVILDFKDTALVAGSNLMVNFRVEDTEGDSTRAFILSDIYPKNHLTTSLDENIFYPTPLEGSYRIINTEYLKRTWPYKLVLSTFQKDFHSIESQQSAFVWIVDDEGKPVPPSNPSSFLTFRNKIGIKWDDNSGNEAGYVVERADSFFPEFVRIAALPKNTTEFTDENVIPNRDYYYRIKAIGTGGSAYSEILEVKEPDITTGLEERVTERESILYPNPADNQLWISWDEGKALPESILIFTTDGKTRKKLSPDYYYEENTYRVPVSDLAPGVYIVRIKTKSRTENRKLIIK